MRKLYKNRENGVHRSFQDLRAACTCTCSCGCSCPMASNKSAISAYNTSPTASSASTIASAMESRA